MTTDLAFASYQAFKADPAALAELDRDLAAKEVATLLDERADRVTTRGIYSTAGFRADTDLMFWWVSHTIEDAQDLLVAFRHTALGRSVEISHSFVGLHRPAEFARDHVPAFLDGKEPKRYISVYPFVRDPEWYLIDPATRGAHLRSHGEMGREYPDIFPNTTAAFGLGDYEWVLAFEADSLDRLVDLIRHLRGNESRRWVKEEIPFITGIRKPLSEVVADLP